MQPNWDKIRKEYINTNTSYRKLAAKHGVSERTLTARAIREKWREQADEQRDANVAAAARLAMEKAAKSVAAKREGKLDTLQAAADTMSEIIKEAVEHLRAMGYEELNPKIIRDLTAAMRDLAYVIRSVYDIPTVQEAEAMRIASSRLLLEQRRAELDDGQSVTVQMDGSAEDYAI